MCLELHVDNLISDKNRLRKIILVLESCRTENHGVTWWLRCASLNHEWEGSHPPNLSLFFVDGHEPSQLSYNMLSGDAGLAIWLLLPVQESRAVVHSHSGSVFLPLWETLLMVVLALWSSIAVMHTCVSPSCACCFSGWVLVGSQVIENVHWACLTLFTHSVWSHFLQVMLG